MKSHHHNNLLDHAIQPEKTNDRRDNNGISPPDISEGAATEPAPRLSGNPQDIICGRGLHIMSHLGNIKLHRIVSRHRQTYQKASRREKAAIAQRIVDEIKSTGSRFIRRAEDGRDDEWVEVDNETSYKKVGHALRLKQNHPQQRSLQARSGLEMPQHHDSNVGSSHGTLSTALNHQVVGMTIAVPQNAMMYHPSSLPVLSAPDPWHPLLGHHLQPIGSLPGLQPQPQAPPSAVNTHGHFFMNTLFASVFQSTLSALAQSSHQRGPPLPGQMRNHQGAQDATVGPCQESASGTDDMR